MFKASYVAEGLMTEDEPMIGVVIGFQNRRKRDMKAKYGVAFKDGIGNNAFHEDEIQPYVG